MNQSITSLLKFLPLVACLLVALLAANPLHAQCPPNPNPPTTHPNGVIEGPVSCIADLSVRSTVGIDSSDRFIISFERPFANATQVWALRFDPDGTANGNTFPISDTAFNDDFHHSPSLAMSPLGRVRVGWLGHGPGFPQQPPDTLLLSDFDFGAFPPIPTPAPVGGTGDNQHSVGTSDAGVAGQTFSNALADAPRLGIVYQVGASSFTQIRTCDRLGNGDLCFINETVFTPHGLATCCVSTQRRGGGDCLGRCGARTAGFSE